MCLILFPETSEFKSNIPSFNHRKKENIQSTPANFGSPTSRTRSLRVEFPHSSLFHHYGGWTLNKDWSFHDFLCNCHGNNAYDRSICLKNWVKEIVVFCCRTESLQCSKNNEFPFFSIHKDFGPRVFLAFSVNLLAPQPIIFRLSSTPFRRMAHILKSFRFSVIFCKFHMVFAGRKYVSSSSGGFKQRQYQDSHDFHSRLP